MTTRNLDALFHPRSIALIGASNKPGSVGEVLARNLLEGGFSGPVMPVNPHEPTIRSAVAYPSVTKLPHAPDLAVVATPGPTVPGIVSQLGELGCRAAVIISAGFESATTEGRARRQSLLDASRPHLLRLLGPNCLGFISPGQGINASFAHLTPKAGGLALVSQSGAIATAALDWAHAREIGFSHVVTIGDAADIDVGDLLDYLALDPQTRAILLYVESITDARKFMTAGRIAARSKPVVVVKAGRSAAGAKAAFSHTGAMAGADIVYDAAFRRAGMLRVADLRELFDAVATVSAAQRVTGDRLAILTNGGGAGVLAVDALEAQGGVLADLAPQTVEAISRAASTNWSHRNPADILGDARPGSYRASLAALLEDPGADAVLVMNCPTAVTDSGAAAEAVIGALAERGARSHKPVLTCWLGETAVANARRAFTAAGLPTHETPDEAVRAFMHLVRHRRNQQLMLQTPTAVEKPPEAELARNIVREALGEGRTVLTDPEARAVLRAYGIPTVEDLTATTPAEAAQAARALGGRVALKILSRDISHKSDLGGVALDLSPDTVETAAETMLQKIRERRPDARLDGFIVQPMVSRPLAQELIAGLTCDPTFGPVVLFGQGGVAAEVVSDRSVALPPLDNILAGEMIARTRVAKLLAGFRNRPPADMPAVQQVLIALGQLAADIPQIAELDINPLLADTEGVLALDARVAIREPPAGMRTAILPCPAALERQLQVDGQALFVRPVRPQDAPKLIDMVARSSPDDIRLRFFGAMRSLSPELAARLSQIDYDREMALVAEEPQGDIIGVARLVADPEGKTAEYALLVRSDRQHHGLGGLLLAAILDHARECGIEEVWGEVARENDRMLELADEIGFSRDPGADFTRVRVSKRLQTSI